MVPEIWSVSNRIFCHFGQFFALLPPNNPKNQNFEKMKKIPRDIIILHMCTINDNHMMHGSWDIESDGQIFLSFWTIFCPFNALTTLKNQISFKIKKTPGDIIILHMCTKNNDRMMYGSWNMVRDRRTDGWTDGQADQWKKVTYRDGYPT